MYKLATGKYVASRLVFPSGSGRGILLIHFASLLSFIEGQASPGAAEASDNFGHISNTGAEG